MTQEQQKKDFHQDIINLYRRIRKEVKYTPPQLLEMINKYGGYEAAIKFIVTDSNIFLFSLLWEQERLDLSIEALITKESYQTLFSTDIASYCSKRLKEYNYAPKKIEVENPAMDAFLEDFFENMDEETLLNTNKILSSQMDNKHDWRINENQITVEQWKSMLTDEKIFSAKNQDFVIRMYLMGANNITNELLEVEDGYSTAYPYKEVITALGKRIKTSVKVDMPQDKAGKPIAWHILFTGWLESSKTFCLSLRKQLRDAIKELIEENKLVTEGIIVKNVVENVIELEDLHEIHPEIKQVEPEPSPVSTPVVEPEPSPVSTPVVEPEPSLVSIPVVEPEPSPVSTPVVEPELSLEALPDRVEVDAINKLKEACISYYGAVCDICGFDFGYTYGERFEDLITVYAVKDGYISSTEMIECVENVNPHKDLIPLCANCHKVLTNGAEAITIDEVKKNVK